MKDNNKKQTIRQRYYETVWPVMVEKYNLTRCPFCGVIMYAKKNLQIDHLWPRTVTTIYMHENNLIASCGCGDILDRATPAKRRGMIEKFFPDRHEWLKRMAAKHRFIYGKM